MLRTPCVISLGSVNVDVHVRAPRWPEPGESLGGRDFLWLSGGKGANVARQARLLGVDTQLVGRVGDDPPGEQVLHALRAAGVDVSLVFRVPDVATGFALVRVHADARSAILFAANANEGWTDPEIEAVEAALANAPAGSVLVVDLEIGAEVARRAMRAARDGGLRVVLDPSPARRTDPDLLSLCDYLTPAAAEARLLTGRRVDGVDDALYAGRALRRLGAGAALVKLPDGGTVLVDDEREVQIAAPPTEPVDTTGAGDAFAGALAAALLEGLPPTDAARFATIAAAHAVAAYGSQPAYATRPEIDEDLPHIAAVPVRAEPAEMW